MANISLGPTVTLVDRFGWPLDDATHATPIITQTALITSTGPFVDVNHPLPVSTTNGTTIENSTTILAAASGSVSLAAAVGKTTYIRGFIVTAAAAAAVVSGLITITGLTITMNFQFDNLVTGQSILSEYFGEAGIPASAANTAITVNIPAITGGAAIAVSVWGYQL